MKKILFILLSVAVPIFFTSCENEQRSGTSVLKLSITDAPVDTAGLAGVFITINEIQVHTSDYGWENLEGFEGPKTLNLLDLTRGVTDSLGDFVLPAGNYTQIRFMLDAPEKDKGSHSNPGCYLLFDDEATIPLFVPSGSQSGFKAVGEFMAPINDTVIITADFDVRKSVVKAGNSGKYLLKPTIRLIVEGEAGHICGSVTNIPDNTGIVIYAYADGTYKDEEASDPAAESTRFPNAVNSDVVDSLGGYHIAFLAEGKYDLVVTSLIDNEFGEVLGIIEDIVVESHKGIKQDIDIAAL